MSLQNIFDDCGVSVTHYSSVPGGDINEAYCLYQNDTKYFLKVNDANKFPGMFAKERNGLTALHNNCSLVVPSVIKCGVAEQQQYLLLEWLEKGSSHKDFWEQFGAGL